MAEIIVSTEKAELADSIGMKPTISQAELLFCVRGRNVLSEVGLNLNECVSAALRTSSAAGLLKPLEMKRFATGSVVFSFFYQSSLKQHSLNSSAAAKSMEHSITYPGCPCGNLAALPDLVFTIPTVSSMGFAFPVLGQAFQSQRYVMQQS